MSRGGVVEEAWEGGLGPTSSSGQCSPWTREGWDGSAGISGAGAFSSPGSLDPSSQAPQSELDLRCSRVVHPRYGF